MKPVDLLLFTCHW